MFKPKSRHNFGQLLCSASNSMGKQLNPCVIQVVMSELPDPVAGCFFDNITSSSFGIYCQPSASSSSSSSSKLTYLFDVFEKDNDDEEQPQQVVQKSSEFPSLHLDQLRAATIYSVQVYALGLRGKSAAASHQTRTLSESGSGRIELSNGTNKRSKFAAESSSLSDRLISYLNFSDYLRTASDTSKPIMGIALAVLLCAFSALIVSFFLSRVCRQQEVNRTRKRKQSQPPDWPLTPESEKLFTFDKRRAQLDPRAVQLRPNNGAALGGSGSDTSRETNTDSTLISSATNNNNNQTSAQMKFQMKPPSRSYLQTCSPSPLMISQCINLTDSQQQQQTLYATMKRSNFASPTEQPNTPQVSIRSGSDCTSSNNNDLAMDAAEFQQEMIVDRANESVYVIGRRANEQQQLHVFANSPHSFWPYNEQTDNCDANQVSSSITTGDSFDRTLSVNATPMIVNVSHLLPNSELAIQPDNNQQQPLGFLPSSLSIPVSLSDCMMNLRLEGSRRHSQDFARGQQLYPPNGNATHADSYLTLTPNNHLNCARFHNRQGSSSRNVQLCNGANQQQLLVNPPEAFNGKHAVCMGPFSSLDRTAPSCTFNLSEKLDLPCETRRLSFDGSIGQTRRHHVKFQHDMDYSDSQKQSNQIDLEKPSEATQHSLC